MNIKRIVIAGCRDYDNFAEAKTFIDDCLSEFTDKYAIVVLSGGARGADAIGERYAKQNGFEVERYPADWARYGKGAGLRRNKTMAEVCDLVICFWDGKSRGTKSMIEYARKCGKPVKKNINGEKN